MSRAKRARSSSRGEYHPRPESPSEADPEPIMPKRPRKTSIGKQRYRPRKESDEDTDHELSLPPPSRVRKQSFGKKAYRFREESVSPTETLVAGPSPRPRASSKMPLVSGGEAGSSRSHTDRTDSGLVSGDGKSVSSRLRKSASPKTGKDSHGSKTTVPTVGDRTIRSESIPLAPVPGPKPIDSLPDYDSDDFRTVEGLRVTQASLSSELRDGALGSPEAGAALTRKPFEGQDPRSGLEYIAYDEQLATVYLELQEAIHEFADRFFSYGVMSLYVPRWLSGLSKRLTRELVSACNMVGSCGRAGIGSWQDSFTTQEMRVMLMEGVVNKALKEHVFEELLFGATEEQTLILEELEAQNLPNGFDRAAKRAKLCNEWLLDNGNRRTRFPDHFRVACTKITTSLYALVSPLLPADGHIDSADEVGDPVKWQQAMSDQLYLIVQQAGCMAIRIRLSKDTIYQFQPCFKEQQFDDENMQDACNRFPKFALTLDRWEKREREEEKEAFDNLDFVDKIPAWFGRKQKLVSMVGHEALVAYRKGGWNRADRDNGFRRRVLVRASVVTRFGHQKPIPAKVGKDGKVVDDGFRRLSWKDGEVFVVDRKGVGRPLGE